MSDYEPGHPGYLEALVDEEGMVDTATVRMQLTIDMDTSIGNEEANQLLRTYQDDGLVRPVDTGMYNDPVSSPERNYEWAYLGEDSS